MVTHVTTISSYLWNCISGRERCLTVKILKYIHDLTTLPSKGRVYSLLLNVGRPIDLLLIKNKSDRIDTMWLLKNSFYIAFPFPLPLPSPSSFLNACCGSSQPCLKGAQEPYRLTQQSSWQQPLESPSQNNLAKKSCTQMPDPQKLSQ